MRFQLDVISPGPGSVPGDFLFDTDLELVLTITAILFAAAVAAAAAVLVIKAFTDGKKSGRPVSGSKPDESSVKKDGDPSER